MMKKLLCMLICVVLLMGVLPATVSAAETEIKTLNIKIKDPVASYTPGGVVGMDSNIDDPMGYLPMKIATWEDTFYHKTLTYQDEFVAGLPYKVTVNLSTFVGYSFARDIYGQLAAKITINGHPVTVDKVYYLEGKITEVTVSYQYEPLGGMVISSALVKNVPTPVAGNTPSFSFTLGANCYGFYPTEPVTWYDETAKRFLKSDDTFIQGHRYRVQIWLAADRENGYTFKVTNGNPDVNVTLNSFTPDSVVTAYEQDPREVISIGYTFPACKAHTCAPTLVAKQEPTCLMPGFKAYYECSCGKCFEDAAGKKEITDMDGYGILAALGHVEGSWSYNGTHHYKKCTRCQEVIPGTTDAHIGGNASISQTGICSICGSSYKGTNTFPDVQRNAWYYNAVEFAVAKGYFSGNGDGTFAPGKNITRQDFVVVLSRIAGADLSKYSGKTNFTDVPSNAYYAKAIHWATNNGIISGYNATTFGVGDSLTREQLVTILSRYAQKKGVNVTPDAVALAKMNTYSDANKINPYMKNAVAWALANKVISGMNETTIAPQGNATRAQVAAILMNINAYKVIPGI